MDDREKMKSALIGKFRAAMLESGLSWAEIAAMLEKVRDEVSEAVYKAATKRQ